MNGTGERDHLNGWTTLGEGKQEGEGEGKGGNGGWDWDGKAR